MILTVENPTGLWEAAYLTDKQSRMGIIVPFLLKLRTLKTSCQPALCTCSKMLEIKNLKEKKSLSLFNSSRGVTS